MDDLLDSLMRLNESYPWVKDWLKTNNFNCIADMTSDDINRLLKHLCNLEM